jgi:hypothetical protein
MEPDNDNCNIIEYAESIAAEAPDTEHTSEHQGQVSQLEEATSAQSPTNSTTQPVIVWRGLMLQQ